MTEKVRQVAAAAVSIASVLAMDAPNAYLRARAAFVPPSSPYGSATYKFKDVYAALHVRCARPFSNIRQRTRAS